MSPHLDGYSFDTGAPEEVFLTRAEAQAFVDRSLAEWATAPFLGHVLRLEIVSLADRLQTIKDECRREGEAGALNN